MRTLLILFIICIQSSFSILGAQTFSQKLTTKTKGQVTLHQDQRLTSIIDGNASSSSQNSDQSAQTGKKVKVRGWRIQVFMGGSDKKEEANRWGRKVNNAFNELQYYVKYESPNYRCRVGDFTTKEKAEEYLEKLREAGLAKEAIIVKSEIFIYQ